MFTVYDRMYGSFPTKITYIHRISVCVVLANPIYIVYILYFWQGEYQTYGRIRCIIRVGHNRIYAPYMTVYIVTFLPNIPYIHRIYMVLANPMYNTVLANPVYGQSNAHLANVLHTANICACQQQTQVLVVWLEIAER
jgi:hypothetical protein